MQTVKTHPALQKTIVPEALRIIECAVSGRDGMSHDHDKNNNVEKTIETCIDHGAIDICVSAMRFAEVTNDAEISDKAIKSIHALSMSPSGAEKTLKKGATRAILSMIKSHSDDPEYMPSIRASVPILQRVSQNPENRVALAKQKASETIMQHMLPKLSSGGNEEDANTKRMCTDILANIVTQDHWMFLGTLQMLGLK